MGSRAQERAIFEAFLKIEPKFAGEEIANWAQPTDEKEFPDVICMSKSGRRIGVELGEWLNEGEIQAAKSTERLQDSLLAAVGEQGPNNTENIYLVWLRPKARARIEPTDFGDFRHQLFACLGEFDRRWPAEQFWHSPRSHLVAGDELTPYPILARHLNGIRLFPRGVYGRKTKRQWPEGIDWIKFPSRGGTFSKETMFRPLLQLLADKKEHYGATDFDHLSLVVYYNQALLYNSPVETPRFGFQDVAAAAAQSLEGGADPFHSVYLFVAVDSGRVFHLRQPSERSSLI